MLDNPNDNLGVDDVDNPALGQSEPQVTDEQGLAGNSPNPEEVTEKDAEEWAEEMGEADDNQDEEHPAELGEVEEVRGDQNSKASD